MPNQTFDQTIINSLELPSSGDQNQQASQIYETIRNLYLAAYSGRATDSNDISFPTFCGFLGDGFKVGPTSPLSANVQLRPGIGFIYDPTTTNPIDGVSGLADLSYYKPVVLTATQAFSPPAKPGVGQERYDIIEVRYDGRRDNPQTINIFNLGLDAFQPTPGTQKTLDWTLDGQIGYVVTPSNSTAAISYKSGAAAAVGFAVPPPVTNSPPYQYYKIATIYSTNTTTTYDKDVVADDRLMIWPGNVGRISCTLSVPRAAIGAPTLSNVISPPGIEVFAASVLNGEARFSLFVKSGGELGAVVPMVNIATAAIDAETQVMVPFRVGSTVIEQINGTEQTLIQSAVAAPAGSKIAVGQWVGKFTCSATGFTDGAGTNPAVANTSDPVVYNIQIDIAV